MSLRPPLLLLQSNGKKAIGLDWKKNNFACASGFFVNFSAINEKVPNFTFVEDGDTRQQLPISFLEL